MTGRIHTTERVYVCAFINVYEDTEAIQVSRKYLGKAQGMAAMKEYEEVPFLKP